MPVIHSADTLTLRVTSTLNHASEHHSFGIADVVVEDTVVEDSVVVVVVAVMVGDVVVVLVVVAVVVVEVTVVVVLVAVAVVAPRREVVDVIVARRALAAAAEAAVARVHVRPDGRGQGLRHELAQQVRHLPARERRAH